MDKIEYERMKEGADSHWYFKAKQEIILKVIEDYTNDENIRILDIGCGEGSYFKYFKGVGIEPYGDFNGDNIINDKIENISLCEKFDVILALDVLEHLEDDGVINKFLNNNLKEGGVAIITVPAHRKLYSKHDEVHHHFRRYDRQDFEEVLKAHNHKIFYINTLLYPLEWLYRKTFPNAVNTKMPKKPINSLLYKIFSLEKNFYRKNLCGLSLLAVIKK